MTPISKSASARIQVHFATLPGPRRRKVTHPLIKFIVIAICGVICGLDDFVAIAEFGPKKRRGFRKILDLRAGIPFARPVKCDLLDAVSGRFRAMPAELDLGAPRSDRRSSDCDRRQNAPGQLRQGQQQVGYSHDQYLGLGQLEQPWAVGGRCEEQ